MVGTKSKLYINDAKLLGGFDKKFKAKILIMKYTKYLLFIIRNFFKIFEIYSVIIIIYNQE